MIREVARIVAFFALCISGAWGLSPDESRAAELVMFEQRDCEWCEAWDADVAPAYPATPEGRSAPLRRVDIHAPLPADIAHVSPGPYTPTFVLLDDAGHEVGRIRGYPGADFFWGMLGEILARLPGQTSENVALSE